MVQPQNLAFLAVFALLRSIPYVGAHDHQASVGEAPNTGMPMAYPAVTPMSMPFALLNRTESSEQSYFAYPNYGGLMLAHIVLMTVAWFFILPIGKYISSRLG